MSGSGPGRVKVRTGRPSSQPSKPVFEISQLTKEQRMVYNELTAELEKLRKDVDQKLEKVPHTIHKAKKGSGRKELAAGIAKLFTESDSSDSKLPDVGEFPDAKPLPKASSWTALLAKLKSDAVDSPPAALPAAVCQRRNSIDENHAVVLVPEDMPIFGHYPLTDTLITATCNHCDATVKESAFVQHMAQSHWESLTPKQMAELPAYAPPKPVQKNPSLKIIMKREPGVTVPKVTAVLDANPDSYATDDGSAKSNSGSDTPSRLRSDRDRNTPTNSTSKNRSRNSSPGASGRAKSQSSALPPSSLSVLTGKSSFIKNATSLVGEQSSTSSATKGTNGVSVPGSVGSSSAGEGVQITTSATDMPAINGKSTVQGSRKSTGVSVSKPTDTMVAKIGSLDTTSKAGLQDAAVSKNTGGLTSDGAATTTVVAEHGRNSLQATSAVASREQSRGPSPVPTVVLTDSNNHSTTTSLTTPAGTAAAGNPGPANKMTTQPVKSDDTYTSPYPHPQAPGQPKSIATGKSATPATANTSTGKPLGTPTAGSLTKSDSNDKLKAKNVKSRAKVGANGTKVGAAGTSKLSKKERLAKAAAAKGTDNAKQVTAKDSGTEPGGTNRKSSAGETNKSKDASDKQTVSQPKEPSLLTANPRPMAVKDYGARYLTPSIKTFSRRWDYSRLITGSYVLQEYYAAEATNHKRALLVLQQQQLLQQTAQQVSQTQATATKTLPSALPSSLPSAAALAAAAFDKSSPMVSRSTTPVPSTNMPTIIGVYI
ncbi:hypothetical protein SARC_02970 [Sphaeroforma arctica JP610]|uniref:Uncharacterized protein n=1 Tax=Sphaeroforma arctica JP610 TaxID=667725 RepID=A0A0L0G7D1_9EUKA|nr:hypothetical protein SARC_02970 [Sphaeroforma arctica JP610]KNC84829.1 hypothetical protein SARC_02970 [Sphaeroforma arctica JP610]|eukprot:XP_014158731.1 hypothetical protein SARC_02970 [Sphaeroforma arctica JP610]